MTATGLRRFAVAGQPPRRQAGEHCGLCGAVLAGEHRHLADLQDRSIACACQACALLFARDGDRYRTIPDRVLTDRAAPLTEADWDRLRIPVAIAFFLLNSELDRVVASYPSPAGVTECELDLAVWDEVAAAHPLLAALAPDVEAILVIRGQPGSALWTAEGSSDDHGIETFLVPVDVCYQLSGTLRLNWHGFDGGTEVREILHAFLSDLRERAQWLS